MSEEHTKELEPCPFCGVALILLGDYDHEKAWNWYGHPDADDSDCLLSQHKIRTKSDLRTPMTTDRKAWNRRASVVAPQDNDLCLLCGHKGIAPDGTCMVPVPICSDGYHGSRRCGCECRFPPAAPPSTQPSARVAAEEIEERETL